MKEEEDFDNDFMFHEENFLEMNFYDYFVAVTPTQAS